MAKKRKQSKVQRITEFNFPPGTILARQYVVLGKLGEGWEGEVYLIQERLTGIERTAKFFFPQRNVRDKTSRYYARKLHDLRACPIVIQYHHMEKIDCGGIPVTMLVSEYVEGELLSSFLKRQRGERLSAFQAVHLLHALAAGMEYVHALGEYHGDLHTDNVIVQRYGLGFDLKLLDFYNWESPKRENIENDVVDLVRILYDAVGGAEHYSEQRPEVKAICRGLKRSLILQRFRTAGQLRAYLENIEWR